MALKIFKLMRKTRFRSVNCCDLWRSSFVTCVRIISERWRAARTLYYVHTNMNAINMHPSTYIMLHTITRYISINTIFSKIVSHPHLLTTLVVLRRSDLSATKWVTLINAEYRSICGTLPVEVQKLPVDSTRLERGSRRRIGRPLIRCTNTAACDNGF